MKKVVAIVLSDIHYHIYSQYNEGFKRNKAQRRELLKVFKKAHKLNVPVLFPGDIVHNPEVISNQLLSFIAKDLKSFLKLAPLYGINGNHDQWEDSYIDNPVGGYCTTFSTLFPKRFFCVDFQSLVIPNTDLAIHGIPYIIGNKGLFEYIEAIKVIKGKKNILMLHTDMPGAKDTDGRVVGSDFNIPKNWKKILKKFDIVLCGHIHKHQKLGPNCYMVGAPNQQRKSDKGGKFGYMLLYSDMTVKHKTLNFPKFIELKPNETMVEGEDMYYKKPEKKSRGNTITIDPAFRDNRNSIVSLYLKQNPITDKRRVKLFKNIIS